MGRRLAVGDVVQVGTTQISVCAPGVALDGPCRPRAARPAAAQIVLSPAQRRLLVALCRPLRESPHYAAPASNRPVADELVITVDTVKGTL